MPPFLCTFGYKIFISMSCGCTTLPPPGTDVFEFSNVTAAHMNFEILSGTSFYRYFRFYTGDPASTPPIDLSNVQDVVMAIERMDVAGCNGGIVGYYRLGDGFRLDYVDPTILIMYKWANEKNFPPGTYKYSLKIQFTTTEATVPLYGYYTSIQF